MRSPAGPRRLGTATHISASLFRRLSVFFESAPSQDPKAAKYVFLTPDSGIFVNVQLVARAMIPPPSETPRVSPRKPLCVRLGAEVACVPAFTRESERGAFVREVEKLFEIELWRQFCRLFLVC